MRADSLTQCRRPLRSPPGSTRGLHAGLAAILLSTSACQSLRLPARDLVGTEGAYATLLRGYPAHPRISTVSVLSGPESSEYPNRSVECQRSSVATRVRWAEGALSTGQAAQICEAAARAAALPLQANRLEPTPVRYRITIVSDGGGTWQQLPTPDQPVKTVGFWFPSGRDIDSLRRRVITATAHEFQHIASGLSGQARRGGQREPDAYLAGACAQLWIEGTLARADLPGGHDPRADPVLPFAARRSGHAGAATGKALLKYFGDADILHVKDGSSRFIQHCHEKLGFPLQH